MSIITLIIAGLLLIGALVLCFVLPHPATWLCTAVLAGIFFFILIPKYQNEQQALARGIRVETRLKEVRSWSRRQSGGDTVYHYEIITTWYNPTRGREETFVSAPLDYDPARYLPAQIWVQVDPTHPQAYVMDTSFLPKNPPFQ